ncbi:hypothetical protein LMG31506_05314 [Cupriavidus yeoncheonensis]|uniref:Porin domain-containing protein n=1 Tax=Cupriavidus yeoncheonensis TaxID=1462994 RepID=A0A916IZ33_9BURK|nr:porin [Cupriavidus yeoncheonensis]CAG2155188.1 hypothetical protein LMG31506_05314 [Cupriavidus yeoncheonensis]
MSSSLKRTGIAVACGAALAGSALLSTSALAQSNVILYGVLDAPVEYVSKMASSPPTLNNGQVTYQPGGSRFAMGSIGGLAGPRWGLRGTEDLGGGKRAIFVLESGFGVDTGMSGNGGRLFGRQAYVGLQSEAGQIMFGRQYTPLFETLANFGPLRYASLYEPVGALTGLDNRSDNTVKYSGTFGGLTAMAHYSFGTGVGLTGMTPLAGGGAGEVPGHGRDNTGFGAGVSYFTNGFGAALAYDEWHPAITAGNAGKQRKLAGALRYTIGDASVMGGYRWGSTQFADGTTLSRDDFWWAGANYQLTPAVGLQLGYYYWNLKSVRLTQTAAATSPASPWEVAFVADYAFSKRTDVYLTTAYARNAGLNFDTSNTGFATGYFPTPGQRSMVGVAVGIRQVF